MPMLDSASERNTMTYETNLPEQMPEPGFYYHYKHDATKGVRDYAYFIWGTEHHTEDVPPEEAHFMNYQPLYESAFVYRHGKMFDNRPLAMFFQDVDWNGKKVARFTRITDPEVVKELQKVHQEMYPHLYKLLGILI